ncbi:MAG: hypothetical protein VB855_08405 [Pirellulaceae bacterium]
MNTDFQMIAVVIIATAAVLYLAYRGFRFVRSGGAGGCSACPSNSCSEEQAVHEIQVRPSSPDTIPGGEVAQAPENS